MDYIDEKKKIKNYNNDTLNMTRYKYHDIKISLSSRFNQSRFWRIFNVIKQSTRN